MLRQLVPSAIVRGFSYSEPGFRYTRDQTLRAPEEAEILVAPYLPFSGVTTTYLAFSYAGTLFMLGLARALQSQPRESAQLVQALVLVQPAFLLNPSFIPTLRSVIDKRGDHSNDTKRSVHPAITYFLGMEREEIQEEIVDEIVEAATELVETHHIPVYMLYWPGDQFIAYPDALLSRLRRAGVRTFPLYLRFPPELKPFSAHCQVARSERVEKRLAPIIRRIVS